jgi:hypothetical protein
MPPISDITYADASNEFVSSARKQRQIKQSDLCSVTSRSESQDADAAVFSSPTNSRDQPEHTLKGLNTLR